MDERSYQYPAKNRVRAMGMKFLPPLTHRDDHVLYLPAPENLEFEGYRSKGLQPSQMVGAEHSKDVFPLVEENARGIRLVQGSVSDAVALIESWGIPLLRAAHLDFDGSQHTFTEELLSLARVMPSPRGSSLIITSHAARDQNALVQGTVNGCKILSGLPSLSGFLCNYYRMMGLYEKLLRLIPHNTSTAVAHLQRELGLLWWVVVMFGVIDPGEDGYYKLDQEFLSRSERVFKEIHADVQEALDRRPSRTELTFFVHPELRDLLASRRVCADVTAMRRVAYWSQGRQPMRTWMFKIQPILSGMQKPTMQDLLERVWELACLSPLVYVDREGEIVTFGGSQFT